MTSVTHTFGSSRITHEVPMYDDMACDVCSADLRVSTAYWRGRKEAAQIVESLLLTLLRSAPMHSFVMDRQGAGDIAAAVRGGEQA